MKIDIENRVFIIAEAGVNHNGDIKLAKKLIKAAAEAGANAVKFQTFKAEDLVCAEAPKARYQDENVGKADSQLEMLKKLELSRKEHEILIDYCNEKGILFLSTPFDIKSLHMLNELNIPIIKIPSGEITNLPLLEEISCLNKEIIISTGMSDLKEIEHALKILTSNNIKKKNITVLHCNTQYPTPFEDVNLLAMKTIQKELDVKIGYSDHTVGLEVSLAAVSLGAMVIEKHFTLDKEMLGPDHKASLDPKELSDLVNGIRRIEKALGNGVKIPSRSEKENIEVARKSIVARCNIKKGEIFTKENLTTKRPGNGISPMRLYDLLDMEANKDYMKDELIKI